MKLILIKTCDLTAHETHSAEPGSLKKTLKSRVWWLMPIIPAIWEGEIRRIMVQGQPGQKVSETPISTNKLAMVVCICNPNYLSD
jgi:hypothetical protein